MSQLLVSSFSSLALVLGVLLGALWLARRYGRRVGRPSVALEVESRVALGRNQGVALVRWQDRTFLVSYGEGGVRRIDDAPAAAEVAEVAPTESETVPFAHHVRRLMGCVILAGALVAASGSTVAAQQVGAPAPGGEIGAAAGFAPALAQLPPLSVQMGQEGDGFRLNGTVGTVVLLGLLAVAPTLLLLTTSFTRILVVLHFLRQALGTQNTPPGHLLAALALLLTGVVMAPTLSEIHRTAVQPWSEGVLDEGAMMERAIVPLRGFMLDHTRTQDLQTFLDLDVSGRVIETEADIPNVTLMSAFALSELRAAFEIGFALFLPFVVIDLVVAAVLTSMGMFMLPPTMIALPCKLMLFVLMDGWSLVVTSIVQSFV